MGALNGKCKFQLDFIERASVAVTKSIRGVLGVLLFDSTKDDFTKKEYYSATEIDEKDYTVENFRALKAMAFRGNAFKVIIYKATKDNVSEVLKQVKLDEPNYFCCPFTEGEDKPDTLKTDLESWINSIRNVETIKLGNDTSTIKLVISSSGKPDKPWIIDYDSRQKSHTIVDFEEKAYTAQEYTLCIASMCAGVALNSSITNMEQSWLKSFITEVDDENTAIGEGKLLTSFDGSKYVILRGITSFTTATDTQNRSFSKIRKMEIMDLHQKDIRNVFNTSYRGKFQNIYSNKLLFLAAVNAYLLTFTKAGQLDPANENKMKIDIEATREWIIGKGTFNGKPISEEEGKKLTEYQLLRANTDDILFAHIPDYKPTDVMEDFQGQAIL
ncbi:phage tail sheath protein [Fusobacterium varium]|jgi:hypothetical protein|nr:MAG TPA: tail protein [Caudoviricetes sp.]